jgi:hypothetical protein
VSRLRRDLTSGDAADVGNVPPAGCDLCRIRGGSAGRRRPVVTVVNTVPATDLSAIDPDAVTVDDVAASPGRTLEPADLAPLSPTDRCDSKDCTAQAYLRVRLDSDLELVFCGHHGHLLTPVLQAQGAVIRDDSHLIA